MDSRDEFNDKIITPDHPDWDRSTITIELTTNELHFARLIAEKYAHLVETNSVHKVDRFVTFMDVAIVHANGCPLKLEALFSAPAQELYDDVSGIVRAIDRRTGKLRGFTPKYAFRRLN